MSTSPHGQEPPARPTADNVHRGHIVPIGGAEDKVGAEKILKRFVEICGGRQARIAVIPTAIQQQLRNGSAWRQTPGASAG